MNTICFSCDSSGCVESIQWDENYADVSRAWCTYAADVQESYICSLFSEVEMATEDSVRSRVHPAPPPAQSDNQEKSVAEIRRDYIENLNQWLWQCYHWQQVSVLHSRAGV